MLPILLMFMVDIFKISWLTWLFVGSGDNQLYTNDGRREGYLEKLLIILHLYKQIYEFTHFTH